MPNKSPAFQFYPADFLSDSKVILMSNEEVGCYIKLICHGWLEGSIPSNIEGIALLLLLLHLHRGFKHCKYFTVFPLAQGRNQRFYC